MWWSSNLLCACFHAVASPNTPTQGMNPCMTGLSKVFVYEWNDRGLTGIAFVDCDSQVLQLRSFRHYIVCSDVHKSVQVLRFREDVRMIEAIASDYCNGR